MCPAGLRYQVYGLSIISEFAFPELQEFQGSTHDVHVGLLCRLPELSSETSWFMKWSYPSGEDRLACGRTSEGYILRFFKLADFIIDRLGSTIFCVPGPGTPSETFRHLLLDQVLPLVLNLRGGEALHASAVATGLGAVAFAGPSGAGKSTIAAVFQQAGAPLLTDDCLAISEANDTIQVAPGYPGLRLWKKVINDIYTDQNAHARVAHYTSKQRVQLPPTSSSFCSNRQPLRAVYILEQRSSPASDEALAAGDLTLRDGLVSLLSLCFRLDINDSPMLVRQFRFFERVAGLVPIRRLFLPQNPQRSASMREVILADLLAHGTKAHADAPNVHSEAPR